ncbi:oligopeptidase A [Marinobacter lutaoensis]|jgi:oligopeptidase A|uniref:oligopeptidase A n=1 Tax=Marinobacter lutaoensis TaxID=135739 RepID=A0A1V2DVP2_9GAMM|nr:oligopeptidase A [Marinobacter lutaoensis]MBE03001.1 oligopeptidase A [Marinobacter sp.]MBI43972.1 oligopeptidase A [Oceanospirillales bacterium]NVD34302.1 oligopeptidase A [Marinobacter lutaoensis]ONF44446.1 oligopeptidase A [Marinobacter lutaoensis]|tara:strand:+ start:3744 stop:5789 length:2046 start_codon:yes stop_codon:yes gene_type:complete
MNNPLLTDDLLPKFEHVRTEHMETAIDQILSENRVKIQQLAQQEDPTWETLALPMEALENRLSNAWSVISHLNGVMNNDELRQVYKRCLEKLTEYSTEVSQNAALCNAYKKLAARPDFADLSEAQRKAVENTLRDFHLGGVDLPEDQKKRYADLSRELAELCNKFSDNVLDATQHWYKHITDPEVLAGLPETALEGARQAARQRQLDGFVITLDFPSFYPVMTYCDNRELRREVYEAYVTRASDQGPDAGRWDNTPVMAEILKRRHALARLLGFNNYAERSLATKMARSVDEVMTFLNQLAAKSKPVAEREFAELRAFAREQYGIEDLQAWDVGYYSEKLRQQRYDISPETLRPWFPVDRVVSGLFKVAEKLFGVQIEARPEVETWHPDAHAYCIRRDGEPVAWFYLDLYARQGKRGGAWMADCRVRWRDARGRLQLPVAFLTCNFTPPVDGKPSLLTHDEVTTLFHEFGHGLHHMLTQVEVLDVSGINGVAWDAVELPSQFLENWCWHPESLALIAAHHETGEPLPEALLEKLLAAKNFQSGMAMVRQLEFALFDFRLHAEFTEQAPTHPLTVHRQVREEIAVVQAPEFNRFPNSFSHIFAGGYAAGYYSYKWAEVLAADAFSLFEEHGIFDPATGRAFLEHILEKGGSREPMALFKAFRGREPKVDALLRQSGMIDEAA